MRFWDYCSFDDPDTACIEFDDYFSKHDVESDWVVICGLTIDTLTKNGLLSSLIRFPSQILSRCCQATQHLFRSPGLVDY